MSINAKLRRQLNAAIAARDEGMRQAEDSDLLGWDRHLVDQAIDAFAAAGEPFSANTFRDLLPPDVNPAIIGARFMAASVQHRIRPVDSTPSSKESTHYKRITLWVGVREDEPVSA